MAGYVYQGTHTGLDLFDAVAMRPPRHYPARPPVRKPRLLRPCGTRSAYKRHLANDEHPCDPCIQAMREYQRKQYAKKVGRS